MSERFGQAALRLSGIAARLLGWRPDEFWRATPAELAAALVSPERHQAGLGRADLHRLMDQDHDDDR